MLSARSIRHRTTSARGRNLVEWSSTTAQRSGPPRRGRLRSTDWTCQLDSCSGARRGVSLDGASRNGVASCLYPTPAALRARHATVAAATNLRGASRCVASPARWGHGRRE